MTSNLHAFSPSISFFIKFLICRLRKIDNIFVFGTPATSVIALGSDQIPIYQVAAGLERMGWNLNTLQFPSGIHLCVTHVHTQAGLAEKFVNDVRNVAAEIVKNPPKEVEGMVTSPIIQIINIIFVQSFNILCGHNFLSACNVRFESRTA